MKPLISIITVVYNGKKFLEETIQSVINQTYKNIEYIIIDGGSTDGTVDIIKKYEEYIDYWVSEKDNGIYDAMNKGIDVANGDFVLFMNGGDMFYIDTTIQSVVGYMDDMNRAYFGRAETYSDDGYWLHPNKGVNQSNVDIWLKNGQPNHQTIFFPKVFYKNEKYDLKYKIFGDSDYKYRAESIVGFVFIDIIVCKFAMGGVSSAFDSYKDVKTMMHEAWIGRHHKGLSHTLKRIAVYNIKYIIRLVFGEKLFFTLLQKLK